MAQHFYDDDDFFDSDMAFGQKKDTVTRESDKKSGTPHIDPPSENVDLTVPRSTSALHTFMPFAFLTLGLIILVCLITDLICNYGDVLANNPKGHLLGVFGYGVATVLFKGFGLGAFALPLCLGVNCYCWKRWVNLGEEISKSIVMALTFIPVSALSQVVYIATLGENKFSSDYSTVEVLKSLGCCAKGGGIVGGWIGNQFFSLLNTTGAILFLLVILVGIFIYITGITPSWIKDKLALKRELNKNKVKKVKKDNITETALVLTENGLAMTTEVTVKKKKDKLAPIPIPHISPNDSERYYQPDYIKKKIINDEAAKKSENVPSKKTTPDVLFPENKKKKPTTGTFDLNDVFTDQKTAKEAEVPVSNPETPVKNPFYNDGVTVSKTATFLFGKNYADELEGKGKAQINRPADAPNGSALSDNIFTHRGKNNPAPTTPNVVNVPPQPNAQATPGNNFNPPNTGKTPSPINLFDANKTQYFEAHPNKPNEPEPYAWIEEEKAETEAQVKANTVETAPAFEEEVTPVEDNAERKVESIFESLPTQDEDVDDDEPEEDDYDDTVVEEDITLNAPVKPTINTSTVFGNNTADFSSRHLNTEPPKVVDIGMMVAKSSYKKKSYHTPPLSYLHIPEQPSQDDIEEVDAKESRLIQTLADFGVTLQEVTHTNGPTVTRYEITPSPGISVKRISNLQEDIALSLAVKGIRIETPIPGKSAVGIEVPKVKRQTVYLRGLIENDAFMHAKNPLTACLGADITGAPVYFDLAEMPHLLVAGATGGGKSVCVNSIVSSILFRSHPDEVKLVMIDPKTVEFSSYKNIPHLVMPILTDPKEASAALTAMVEEMERRYDMINEVGANDLEGYNSVTAYDPEKPYMSRIIVVIDELADLMLTARDQVENNINRLLAKARACGIHLIIATQRPSVDVITGLLKANLNSRIALPVNAVADSRCILDRGGAEKLCGKGDMLFVTVNDSYPRRVQGALITKDEVNNICEYIRSTYGLAHYNETVMTRLKSLCDQMNRSGRNDDYLPGGDGEGGGKDDARYAEAVRIAVESGHIATSHLQRTMGVGYGRAAKIIDRMVEDGIVSAPDGAKPRTVLITREQYLQMFADEEEYY